MRNDESTFDEEAMGIAEAEGCVTTNETHAAKWARPALENFNPKEKTITFQVCAMPSAIQACVRRFRSFLSSDGNRSSQAYCAHDSPGSTWTTRVVFGGHIHKTTSASL